MRKRWIGAWGVGILVMAVLAGVGLTYRAARHVPAFYREALQVPIAHQQQCSDQMLQKASALASSVNQPGRWQAVFTADEINGWLAVDLVQNHPRALPPGVTDPRVAIEPDQGTVACRYRQGGWDAVLSLCADVYLAEPNVVAIRVRGARVGALPLPLEGLLEQVTSGAEEAGWRARRMHLRGDPVILLSIPPPKDTQGKTVEIQTLELGKGHLCVGGITRAQ